jgi:hypothetical protein
MKQLAVDTQSFTEMRESNCIYVDKTMYIHKIVTTGRIYFLSRPRRFGKSLTVAALHALFEGQHQYFEGLYIYDKWDWSSTYPVIRIDWTKINHSTPEWLETDLRDYLRSIAAKAKIALQSDNAVGCFRELIENIHESKHEKVVILIDEYDKPVTNHLYDGHLDNMKQAVHDFYQVMKGCDDHIRFIFITGVSKFSGLSVHSALNNPQDISFDPEFAGICGYTQEELETNLNEYIDHAAEVRGETREEVLDGIRQWYDGYSWDGKTRVYNPFSTSKFLKSPTDFLVHWAGSGTPTYLLDIIRRRKQPDLVYEATTVNINTLYNGYSPEAPEDIPMLFQTGYLTITEALGKGRYKLDIPNGEVRASLEDYLLRHLCTYAADQVNELRDKLHHHILDGNEEGMDRCLMALFSVPYQLLTDKVRNYHVAFQVALRALGFKILSEVSNEEGRADAIWELPEATIVAELKYSATLTPATLIRKALKQIRDKRYYAPCADRPVIKLLAVAFTDKTVRCRIEPL